MNTLLIKPTGPACNLNCNYCFYLEKEEMYPEKSRMSLSTAETTISQTMESGEPVTFSWQGGEPTLMGLDFFREVVELQKKHGSGGQSVTNTIQTNATPLDEEWAKFFAKYNFLVGVSLDGPQDLHDSYRTHPDGRGSYDEVMEAIDVLKEYDVQFNVLSVLNSRTVKQPKRILNFFLGHDLRHLQFIPAIETTEIEGEERLADFSPEPEEVGEFLDAVFQVWSEDFPPAFSVRYFESLINTRLGREVGNCRIDATCDSYLVVEHNGDVYPCDFFVEEGWKLGNLNQTPLDEIEKSKRFGEFAAGKTEFGKKCSDCEFLPYCYGGCQRYRGLPGGPENRSYLCPAYKYFLSRNLEEIKEIAAKV